MPAYRSEAEAEIRGAVVDRLRAIRPESRIMHEINVCSYGNRVDVLCVGADEIIAVEIKSAKDKIDRLKAQMTAMRGAAHHCIAALHNKFLVMDHNVLSPPPCVGYTDTVWIYPETERNWRIGKWSNPDPVIQMPLPATALDMLWREELLDMCGRYGVSCGKKPNMRMMQAALRWQLSGRDLTRGICAALRARPSIEADDPIEWRMAA